MKLLRHLQRSAEAWERVDGLRITAEQHRRAERIMLGYIAHLLERKLASVDFIRRLRQFFGDQIKRISADEEARVVLSFAVGGSGDEGHGLAAKPGFP